MKKILTFFLAMIIILSVSASAQAKNADITGKWYFDTYCKVLTMNISDGGIYNMEMMDEAMIGTWVMEDGLLYLDKGTAGEKVFTYDASSQTLDNNGNTFIRKKIKTFKPAKVVSASIEDFAGNWFATKIDVCDAALPLNLDALYMSVMIDGANVVLTESNDKVIKEGEAVFADGALKLTIQASQESENESVYNITMLKDGMISIKTDSIIYYLEKITAGT